jgi:hypothetical protein
MTAEPIPSLSILNGPQQQLLRETILSAYTQSLDFDMLLGRLSKPPLANIAAGETFEQRVFSLIRKAQAQGWIISLIEGIQDDVPDNPLIRNFPDAVRLAGTVPSSRVAAAASRPTFERIARGGGFQDIRIFSRKLAEIGEAICRIETPAGTPNGTGILISPDLVITNYHVVETQIASGANAPEISCRFDYARDVAGIADGVAVTLAADGKWLVAKSPYDQRVDTSGAGIAAPDCLDFAILRLSSAMPAERKPLAIRSDARSIDKNMPVLVVQHPKGTPMALAIGISLGLNENGSRLRYDADTLRGSSGSAVFNQQLDLTALHHLGDSDAITRAPYNQGIPFGKISSALETVQKAIEAEGVSKFWQ